MKHTLTLLAVLTLLLAMPTTSFAQQPATTFHYQPPDTFFGDPIPFYHDGVHHVFYLHPKDGLDWHHLTSRDLVHWEDLGSAIDVDENDSLIATGSIVEHGGLFHAYLQRADSDFAEHVYGGCMALPRELYLAEDGSVAIRLVPEVVAACREDATAGKGASVFASAKGDVVTAGQDAVTLAAKTGATVLAVWKKAPADFFLTADIRLAPGATLHLLLRGNEQTTHPGREHPSALDDSYVLTLDAHSRQIVLFRQNAWNRVPALRTRQLRLPTDRTCKLHVMLHGDVLEAFVDDRISLCARMQLPSGAFALLARDGRVSLSNLRITQLP
jgi:sucrose-6-phosphate hydrolase SacC (GH32 family)